MSSEEALGRYTEEVVLVTDDPDHDDLQDWLSPADLSHNDTFSFGGCMQLDRRWILWHKFMNEYSCLDDWLRLAEKSAASPNTSNVLYNTAKEELQKFESLRTEARLRLPQLDSLSQTCHILLRLFRGSMKTRLIDMAKECGQRWDQLSTTLDTVCHRLKHFVVQREDFERQQQEMAIWLADVDLKLTEVEHFSELNTCAKMRQLQGFQEAVAESAGRLNALLQQGEELIQRSEPADAQVIESQLQDLLLYCARVFQGLGRLHTRLLSMRLVFEDDWVLCPDSGCPSEALLEEESVKDHSLAPSVQGNHSQVCQDQLVLEWDPSVDIGGSITHAEADLTFLSADAGVYSTEEHLNKETWRRRAYQRPAESCPAATTKCIQQKITKCSLDGMTPPQTPVPDVDNPPYASFWKTSTPDSHSPQPITFKTDRVSAWLVQTPRLCSRAVQTEPAPQQYSSFYSSTSMQKHKREEAREADYLENVFLRRRSSCSPHFNNMCSAKSCDLQSHSAKQYPSPQYMKERLNSRDSMKDSNCTKTHCGQHHWSLSLLKLLKILMSPALLCILLALFVVLVIWPTLVLQENQCYRSNSLAHSFHLALCYVNGPPPT